MSVWPTTCPACKCQSRWHPQVGPGPQGKTVLRVIRDSRVHLASWDRLVDKADQEDKDLQDHEDHREKRETRVLERWEM